MYRALKSFSGVVSMAVGDIRDIPDALVVIDLIRAGYIEEVKEAEEKEEQEVKATKKKTKK